MKKTEAERIFGATFLPEVFGIIEGGNFIDSPYAVKDGMVVIGDMTAFEKWLSTFLTQCEKREKDLVKFFKSEKGDDEKSDEYIQKTKELSAVRDNFETCQLLFRNSLKVSTGLWDGGIMVCSGFKIVKLAEKDRGECNCAICKAARDLGFKEIAPGVSIKII